MFFKSVIDTVLNLYKKDIAKKKLAKLLLSILFLYIYIFFFFLGGGGGGGKVGVQTCKT